MPVIRQMTVLMIVNLIAWPHIEALRAGNEVQTIWNGQSNGFHITWTTSDISASSAKDGSLVFSAAHFAREDFQASEAETRKDTARINRELKREGKPPLKANPCTVEREITLLSVVGSILTFRDHFFAFCEREAHPAGNIRYTAIDLAKPGRTLYSIDHFVDTTKPGKVVQLTDLFPDREILRALTADVLITKALKDRGGYPPRKLSALLPPILEPIYGDTDKGCHEISGDLLTRFAFHHVEGNRVAVRLGLSGCGTCRECLTEIGILLPIPDSLSGPMALAEAGKEGFLLKDMKNILQGRHTKFVFQSKG
jgi:hypothetical protein